MHSIKLTPKMLEGLRWFDKHEPIAWFDAYSPTDIIRKRLKTAGWIEECGSDPLGGGTVFRVTKYQISAAGRAALSSAKGN